MSTFGKVSFIGSGSWGTALCHLFAKKNGHTLLWGRNPVTLQQILEKRENSKYLKGVPLSPHIEVASDIRKVVEESSVLVSSIPSQFVRQVFEPMKDLLTDKYILNASKGIEQEKHLRMSQVFDSINPTIRYAVLSGPNFALEIAKNLPAATTIASSNTLFADFLQEKFSSPNFRVYVSDDVVGVELAGAMKNVYAIATGICIGLDLGFNAQAALINRGMAEMLRLGKKLGGDPLTFLGLSGVGDLILTCTGPLSRNRRLGTEMAKGKSLSEVEEALGGVAEGAYTVKTAYFLAKSLNIDMPITSQVYEVLYCQKNPLEALQELMSREISQEWSPELFIQ